MYCLGDKHLFFRWFVSLEHKVKRKDFVEKCHELHLAAIERLKAAGEPVPEILEKLKFSDRWIGAWERRYKVSLKHNKRFTKPCNCTKQENSQGKSSILICFYFTQNFLLLLINPAFWECPPFNSMTSCWIFEITEESSV